MPSIVVTLINQKGLHARAAAKLATTANRFECQVKARCRGSEPWVDSKSVMSLMLLAAACGTELEMEAEGHDAEAALTALSALVEDRFEENE